MTKAIFTLLYTPEYLPGALVLAATLSEAVAERSDLHLGLLIDKSRFSTTQYQLLQRHFSHIVDIQPIELSNDKLTHLLKRPELAKTFSKVLLWGLDYETVLYMDCDTLPNITCKGPLVVDLLDLDFPRESIVASPDGGFPDVFNSGVFMLHPNKSDKDALLARSSRACNTNSFDGADQGLLNQYFNENPDWVQGALAGHKAINRWIRLPFLYNVTPSAQYQYLPAAIHFSNALNPTQLLGKESEAKVIHYIGQNKPWNHPLDPQGLDGLWWDVFNRYFGKESGEEMSDLTQFEKSHTSPNHFPPAISAPEVAKEITLDIHAVSEKMDETRVSDHVPPIFTFETYPDIPKATRQFNL